MQQQADYDYYKSVTQIINCEGQSLKKGLYRQILNNKYVIGSACGSGENG